MSFVRFAVATPNVWCTFAPPMTTRALASSAVAVVLLVSGAANAQSQPTAPNSPVWLTDRRFNEGQGVRAGDVELHPAIGAQAGYDSNYLLRTDNAGFSNGPTLAPVIPSLEFTVTPSLYLSTLGALRRSEEGGGEPAPVAFRAGINATYRELVGLSSDSSSGSSSNDVSQQRNVSGTADARLEILPQRPWGGAIFASYTRSIQPNTVDANPDLSFNSDVVGAGAEIAMQPGSGTLDWHLGYSLSDTIFEQQAGIPYDNISQQAYTRGRWKFRPRTAFVYDASLRFISYSSNTSASQVNLDTSTPVRARIGLNGLITDRFSVLAMIGWGASFYDTTLPNQPQFDSIIAQGELRWYLSASPGIAKMADVGLALSSIALGYTRDFQNSYLGSFYTQDRGYLKFNYLYGSNFVLSIEGGVAAIEYPNLVWANGDPRHNAFTDARADATLFSEYRFTQTFGINATLRYTANISNVALQVADVKPVSTNPADEFSMQWKRFEAFLGVRWFL
jgi:hypothetical protein